MDVNFFYLKTSLSGTCVEPPATTEAPATTPAPACGKEGIKCYDGDTYAETTCCAGVSNNRDIVVTKMFVTEY